jgi:hypothetical protein
MVWFFPLPHNRTHAWWVSSELPCEVNGEISDPINSLIKTYARCASSPKLLTLRPMPSASARISPVTAVAAGPEYESVATVGSL